MTLEEIAERLGAVGLPLAYRGFPRRRDPPYLIYYEDGGESIGADFKNFGAKTYIAVLLVTEKKDPVLEKKVEAAIDGMPYDKTELWLPEQKLLEITYDFLNIEKER